MPSFARFRTNFFTFLAPLLRRAGAVLPNAPVLFCKFSFHSLLQPFFEMPKMGEKSRKPLSRLSICCAAVECGGYLAVIDSDREVCILAVGQAALFFFRRYYGRGRPFFQTVPKKSADRLFLSLPTTPQRAVLPMVAAKEKRARANPCPFREMFTISILYSSPCHS